MTPANERKAKERKAKRDAGLVRVEVWVPKEAEQSIRAMAERTTRAYMLTRLAQTDAPLIWPDDASSPTVTANP